MSNPTSRADRAARRALVLERDGDTCIWCGRSFAPLVVPTTEHVVPRVKGGPSWLANEVAACRRCNGERGHRGPVEWLEECLRRGWDADEPRLARALHALIEAIAREGGQRRARPYLDAQLRRLRHRAGPRTHPTTMPSRPRFGSVTTTGRVAGIWIYPVKSLGGTALDRVRLLPSGPEGDRAWSVVDAATGEVVRGKHAPALAGMRPSGDPAEDERVLTGTLGRPVRLRAENGSAADVAAVHLVSRQAVERAAVGDVPEGCSADDPRANVLLDLPAGQDERTWVGRSLRIGGAELTVTRTPKHCLGVYAEVRQPGEITVGDPVLL